MKCSTVILKYYQSKAMSTFQFSVIRTLQQKCYISEHIASKNVSSHFWLFPVENNNIQDSDVFY